MTTDEHTTIEKSRLNNLFRLDFCFQFEMGTKPDLLSWFITSVISIFCEFQVRFDHYFHDIFGGIRLNTLNFIFRHTRTIF